MKNKHISATVLLALLALVLVLGAASSAQAAGSTLSISSPDEWSLHSWGDTFKVRWNRVDGASGYYVTIKNDSTGAYYTQNEYTTSTYYNATDDLPKTPARLKIWVGAVRAKSDEGEDAFTSQIVYVYWSHEPSVSIDGCTAVTSGGATLSLNILYNYGYAISDCGFYVGTSSTVRQMQRYSYGATEKGTKTLTVTGLEPGTTYYYRAYAENDVGEYYTSAKSFTTPHDKLVDPVITTPSNNGTLTATRDATMRWGAVSGAEGYEYIIKRLNGEPDPDEDNEPGTIVAQGQLGASGRSYTLSESLIEPDYWYKFVVKAYADGLPDAWSPWVYCLAEKDKMDDPVISAPANNGTLPATRDVTLRWSSVSEAEGYEYIIKRLIGEPDPDEDNEPGTIVAQGTVDDSVRSYTLGGNSVTAGYWYKFVVKAYADEYQNAWSPWVYAYAQIGKMQDPVITSPTDAKTYDGYQSVLFRWNEVDGADGYELFVKRLDGMPNRNNNNEPGEIVANVKVNAQTRSYTVAASDAIPGKWYKFVVKAYAAGYEDAWSKWVYCKLESAPLGDAEITAPASWATAADGASINVRWSAATGAQQYVLHWKQLRRSPDTANDNEPSVSGGKESCGTSRTFTLPAAQVHGGYWYKFVVEACAENTASSWSNWVYVYVRKQDKLERPVILSPKSGIDYEYNQDIYFSWSEVPSATSYTYYIKQLTGEPASGMVDATDEASSALWTETLGSGKRSVTLTGEHVQPDTWYKFVVQAQASGFEDSWSRYTYVKIPDREDWVDIQWAERVKVIAAESFCDNATLRTFDASESVLECIESRAFANCVNMKSINLPVTVSDIAEDAFENCPLLTIHCVAGSPAEAYADRKHIPKVTHVVIWHVDSLLLSTSGWNIPTADEAQTAVTVSSSSAWRVTDDANWITLSRSSGEDGDTVIIQAQRHTGAAHRTATVTFTCGELVVQYHVTQNSGVVKACGLSVSEDYWSAEQSQTSRDFFVESDSGFTVTSNQSWLTCTVSNNSFTARINRAASPEGKEAVLTVTCTDCQASKQIRVYVQSAEKTVTPVPQGLSVSARENDPHALNVRWNAVMDAVYTVERSPDQIEWKTIKTNLAETTLVDTDNIGADETYYYRVFAVVDGNMSAASAIMFATTTPEVALSFSGVFATLNDGDKKNRADVGTLSWNGNASATRYEVSVAKKNEGRFTTLEGWYHRSMGSNRSASIADLLTEGCTYRVWVGAYNKHGRLFGQTRALSFTVLMSGSLGMHTSVKYDYDKIDFSDEIWTMLTSGWGLSPVHAAAIMGNIDAECGYCPYNSQKYSGADDRAKYTFELYDAVDEKGNPIPLGFGLCQWTSVGRKQGLLDYATHEKGSADMVWDFDTQMEYLKKELNISTLQSYTSLYEATEWFDIWFERPDQDSANSWPGTRYGKALAAYKKYMGYHYNEPALNFTVTHAGTSVLNETGYKMNDNAGLNQHGTLNVTSNYYWRLNLQNETVKGWICVTCPKLYSSSKSVDCVCGYAGQTPLTVTICKTPDAGQTYSATLVFEIYQRDRVVKEVPVTLTYTGGGGGGTALSAKRQAAVNRAWQWYNTTWTTTSVMPLWNATKTVPKGTLVRGIPYTQFNLFYTIDSSLPGSSNYFTAEIDRYKSHTGAPSGSTQSRTGPKYGAECVQLVYDCWYTADATIGQRSLYDSKGNLVTWELIIGGNIGGNNPKVEMLTNWNDIKPGDCFGKSNHIMLIVGVDNGGTPNVASDDQYTVIEQTTRGIGTADNWVGTRKTNFTYSELVVNYKPYRYLYLDR